MRDEVILSVAAHRAPVENWRWQQITLTLYSSSGFCFDPAILAPAEHHFRQLLKKHYQPKKDAKELDQKMMQNVASR